MHALTVISHFVASHQGCLVSMWCIVAQMVMDVNPPAGGTDLVVINNMLVSLITNKAPGFPVFI